MLIWGVETARKQDEPKSANLLDIITPKARGTPVHSLSTDQPIRRCRRAMLMWDVDMMDPQTKAAVLQELEAVLEREVEKA